MLRYRRTLIVTCVLFGFLFIIAIYKSSQSSQSELFRTMETYCSKAKKGLQQSMIESNLSGGSGRDSDIFRMAIDIGSKHQINLKAGKPNKADGNCLYDSIIENVNSRGCFTENFNKLSDLKCKTEILQLHSLSLVLCEASELLARYCNRTVSYLWCPYWIKSHVSFTWAPGWSY